MANTKKISELVNDNPTNVLRVGDQLMLTREGVSYGYENTDEFLIEYSAGVDGFRVSADSSDVTLYSPDGNTILIIQDAQVNISTDGDIILTGNTSISGDVTLTGDIEVSGDVELTTAGSKILVTTGANASIGVSAAMAAGTITISTTAVTADSKIFLTHATVAGTQGILSVGTIVAGTSFVINSSNAADTSTVNWWIIN